MRISIILSLTLLLLNAHHNLFAQNDTLNIYELSIEELMKLEVEIASMVIKDIKKQPVSIFTISGKQLEMSGARTLADALSIYVPGLFMIEDQDDIILGFRGLAPDNNSKVMLLIDGQNVNIEWFWGPPPAILNSGHFSLIDRVEVIRGPGSVTLGQGALLGVINIVTRQQIEKPTKSEIVSVYTGASYGKDNHWGIHGDVSLRRGSTNAFLYIGSTSYRGQKLRTEGWANDKANEGYKGGFVKDIGTRLRRSSNSTLVGKISHNNFEMSTLIVKHDQDLYNFYRDRNCYGEFLVTLNPSFQFKLSQSTTLKIIADATIDDFSLKSVDGFTMGGTRENRFGGKVIYYANDIVRGNRLATGVEYRHFEFGRKNFQGNNFINNIVTQQLIDNPDEFILNANIEKVWAYSSNIDVFSLFAEDYQQISSWLDFFSGLRFDFHPYWGSNLSPRLGAILTPSKSLRLRISYQTGFRGAVGLHYGGGYRQDGLLSEDNFNRIEKAQIPIFNENNQLVAFEDNLPKTKPESMQGFELAADFDFSSSLNFYGIGFYNVINNVIDVGVIWRDPSIYSMVNIGNDVPGDWNGFWFFKNTKGRIIQGGFEAGLSYHLKGLTFSVNHSTAKLISSGQQQMGSMYITQGGNFKAYPENVSRANAFISLSKDLIISLNYLFYYYWYSPNDQKVNSNHLVNLGVNYSLTSRLNASFYCMNLLNQTVLYPMNSNVGDPELSDGTPSVEKTSFFLSIKIDI